MKHLYLIILVALSFNANAQFKIVGYVQESRNMNTIQYDKLTHIVFSFVHPNGEGDLGLISNSTNLRTMVRLAHEHDVKAMCAIGGWNNGDDSPFISLAADSAKRANFISNLTTLVEVFDLDGVDIDWEFPDPGSEARNFELLMEELYAAFNPRGWLVTAAIHTTSGVGVPDGSFDDVDFFNLMAYDMGTPHSDMVDSRRVMDYWIGRGVPKEKLILGVPFYSRPTVYTYLELINIDPANAYSDVYNGAYYNGIPTIQQKTQMAENEGGGIMIWELGHDVQGSLSLLTAIHNEANDLNASPFITITTPQENEIFQIGDSISITAEANDMDGTVDTVIFKVDGLPIDTLTQAPFSTGYSITESGFIEILAEAIDNEGKSSFSQIVTVNVQVPQSHYLSAPHALPGTIQAEDYDIGGMENAYTDTDASNRGGAYRMGEAVDIEENGQGGYSVGFIQDEEWLEYTVSVAEADTFDLGFKVASQGFQGNISLYLNNELLVSGITTVSTGGWYTWENIVVSEVPFPEGEHVLRLFFNSGSFNLDEIRFDRSRNSVGFFESLNESSLVKIYPNPFNDSIRIESTSTSKFTHFKVFNDQGKLVRKGLVENNNVSTLKNLNPGLYTIELLNEVNSHEFLRLRKLR